MPKKQNTLPFYSVITRGIVYSFLLPCLLAIILLGTFQAIREKNSTIQEYEKAAKRISGQLSNYLQSFKPISGLLNSLPDIESHSDILKTLRMEYPEIYRVFILDPERKIIAPESNNRTGYDLSGRIDEIPAKSELSISTPFMNEEGQLVTLMTLPLKNDNFLALEILLEALHSMLQPESIKAPYFMVTDEYGNIIAHCDKKKVRRRQNVGKSSLFNSIKIQGMELGGISEIEGRLYVYGASRMHSPEWTIVLAIPALDILIPLIASVMFNSLGIVVLVALSSFFIRWSLKRSTVRPLESLNRNLSGFNPDNPENLPPELKNQRITEIKELTGVFDDMVSQIQKHSQSLREINQEQELLLDSIDVLIWFQKEPGTYKSVNKAFADFWGDSKNKFQNAPACIQLPEEYHKICAETSKHAFEKKKRSEYEIWLPNSSGEKRLLVISKIPHVEPDGSVRRIICYGVDITKQYETSKALDEAKQKAVMAEKVKTRFLANISHELRTPLHGIIGGADYLAKADEDKERKSTLEEIKHSARHLLSVFTDILDMSNLEQGNLRIVKKDFDLHALLDYLRQKYVEQAKHKNLRLKWKQPEWIPRFVNSDPLRLRQILLNILNNALKFTEQGVIEVSVDISQPRDNQESFIFNFSVADSGPGIDQDLSEQIFMPFTQIDSSDSRKHGGSGLGLSISKRIAKLLNGDISVASTPGQGSNFTLSLPLYLGEKVEAEPDFFSPPNGLNILVAEDYPLNQNLIEHVLKNLGHQTTMAENGQKALKAVREKKFDLIIMDIQMPGMSGTQALKEIRGMKKPISEIPVIALTAHALREHKEEYINLGFDDYLAKPLETKKLQRAISRIFSAQSAWLTEEKDYTPAETAPTSQSVTIEHPAHKSTGEKQETGQDHNWSVNLDDVARALGDKDLVKILVDGFLDIAPKSLDEMSMALENDDIREVGRLAHSMKSSLAQLQITEGRKLAQKLEQAAGEKDRHATGLLWEPFRTMVNSIIEQLKNEQNSV